MSSKHYFRPPKHLVKEWPEVFDDLYMNTMPVAYLDAMLLEFNDGRIWEINIKEHLVQDDPDSVAKKLLQTMNEYKDSIKKVDFKINIDLLKKEIQDRTNKLL